eukprot:6246404-Prymnesium_polylepis.1
MRIEKEAPGRIHAIKVATTRYKTVTTIVFDKSKCLWAQANGDDDECDGDDGGDGEEHPSSESKPHKASASSAPARAPSTATTTTPTAGTQGGAQNAWQQPRKPARKQLSATAPPAAKQVAKVSRNNLSARSGEKRPDEAARPAALEMAQREALARS